MKPKFLLLIIICISHTLFSQTSNLIINPNIQLPKDSVVSIQLIASLNKFLVEKEKNNSENSLIWNQERIETYILLDELKEMEKSEKLKNDFFYNPYLTNLVELNDSTFLIQFSYLAINENEPLFRASFQLIAHKNKTEFLFSSPLIKNAVSWKTKEIGNSMFYFKADLNIEKAMEYDEKLTLFDTKLKAENKKTIIYCCDDFPEVLKMIGVEYKSDYNGYDYGNLSSQDKNKFLLVIGNKNGTFNNFDPHDLWHERLHNVISTSIINRPIDEGCAYLYGGGVGYELERYF